MQQLPIPPSPSFTSFFYKLLLRHHLICLIDPTNNTLLNDHEKREKCQRGFLCNFCSVEKWYLITVSLVGWKLKSCLQIHFSLNLLSHQFSFIHYHIQTMAPPIALIEQIIHFWALSFSLYDMWYFKVSYSTYFRIISYLLFVWWKGRGGMEGDLDRTLMYTLLLVRMKFPSVTQVLLFLLNAKCPFLQKAGLVKKPRHFS